MFEIIYGFTLLTPLDMIHLSVNERDSLDGKKIFELVKSLHEKGKIVNWKEEQALCISSKQRSKKCYIWTRRLCLGTFEKGTLSRANQRDGQFQVLERINDNAYKLDLPCEYNVSTTFNVYDLSLFDTCIDSR